MKNQSEQLLEDLFKSNYGKLVASLTRIFGPANIQLAEDVVQDTLISALDHWGTGVIPDKPEAWLMQVAKRKALNELKHKQVAQKYWQSESVKEEYKQEIGTVFLDDEVEDSLLRMIFTCCHPALKLESQIALTLKTLCGFGVKEVARALLSNEATINKRLYRAKESIRKANIAFGIPQGQELKPRLKAVNITLYLLFNEGYNSGSGDDLIRKELCLEAMRLGKLLVDRFQDNKELTALLSLMCFHTARFEARLDDHGAIVLLEDQDRRKWNKEMIVKGVHYLDRAKGDSSLSAYHIEALIAAEHCLAGSYEETNWKNLYEWYFLLKRLKPNPVIDLNLAIIRGQLNGPQASLQNLKELEGHKELKNYHLLPATQGIYSMKAKRYQNAIEYFDKALKLSPPPPERQLIKSRIEDCKKILRIH